MLCHRPRGAGFLAVAVVARLCVAAPAMTWNYNLLTTGGDAEFVSPSAIDPALPAYRLSYQVQQMLAMAELVGFPGFPLEVDVTSELAPEFQSGLKILAGPPPLELIQADVTYPEGAEPNAAGFRSQIRMSLREDGRGVVAATNNILSELNAEFPPGSGFFVNVRLLSVRLIGTISAEPAGLVAVSPASLLVPEGSARQLGVSLSQPPAGSTLVNVAITGGDSDFAVVGGATLTFTPQNWSTPQFATVRAEPDADGAAGQATLTATAAEFAAGGATLVESEPDCNANGVPDASELGTSAAPDCNGDLIIDSCEVSSGFVPDCNGNGAPDSCDLIRGVARDCNNNGVLDVCDIGAGVEPDCDADGTPDRCQPDRDGDGRSDACDGCPDDPSKQAPGACGCGLAEAPDCAAEGGQTAADIPTESAPGLEADNSVSAPDNGPATPENPIAEPILDEASELDAPLAELCGAGVCGVAALGWAPLTALGLLALKRPGRR